MVCDNGKITGYTKPQTQVLTGTATEAKAQIAQKKSADKKADVMELANKEADFMELANKEADFMELANKEADFIELANKEADFIELANNKVSFSGWIIFWLAVVGGLIFITSRVSNRKKVELSQEPKIESPYLQTDDTSLEELLGIDLAWPAGVIIKHLQTESEKWNDRLKTMTDGPEKESTQSILSLVSEARKKYE